MKKISLLILFVILFASCNPSDCLESTGDIIQQEKNVSLFNRIKVGNEVSLILKHGNTQKVIIEAGENLIDEISVEIIGDQLILIDENSCNYTRDYTTTKIYVTSPNITELRSDTARLIKSDGVLNYTDLTIYSENFHEDALNIGNFDLNLNTQNLKIVSNGDSIFTMKGNTDQLTVVFASGSCRFNGKNLIANEVIISQKSTNDILLHPTQSLTGNIYANGDVISFNHPNIVAITEHYTGKLIFN